MDKEHQTSQGLTPEEAQKRLQEKGLNVLTNKKKRNYVLGFLGEFKDLMIIILIAASLFAFFSGETTDAIIIIFVVLLNGCIGFVQKYKAEKALDALKKLLTPKARVLRGGKEAEIEASHLVPGDVIILEEGDRVNADAVLFEANELRAQESVLTGESSPVEKESLNDLDRSPENMNTVFMGSLVTHGTAKALVIKTGMETEMGKIARLTTETKKDKSPLEKELQNIGVFVGKFTFVITVILFIVGVFLEKRGVVETLIFATSVAVAAVPEGLPATITIALAIGAQRLAKNKAIVKQLSSIETLGATTVICTDKTGTITQNEMTVKEIYFDRYHVKVGEQEPEQNRHELKKMQEDSKETFRSFEILNICALLCNDASFYIEGAELKVLGDPTETALIKVVRINGFDVDAFMKNFVQIHEFPFDSTRKRMTVVMQSKNSGKYYVFCKGAPASILGKCSHMMLNNHAILQDEETFSDFIEKNEKMAEQALRCLGFAYRELSAHELRKLKNENGGTEVKFQLTQDETEQNLIFLGLMGMMDPPRPEVAEAIGLAQRAGIKVYMVTGDHGLTAEAVAKQIGLLQDKNYKIVYGEELDAMDQHALKKLFQQKHLDIIFARVNPSHKLKIISALKDLDEVVAMTGDGVNDAPALKRADIGVAMGMMGTDVSKEAANMILSDDSFATIVKAVKEGRTIYDNLKKFIFYIFSSNTGELILVFGALILNLPMPLTAILILFVNLTTDVLPAVALGVEPAEKSIMDVNPRQPKQKILNGEFVAHIFTIGFVVGATALIAYMWDLQRLHVIFGNTLNLQSLNYAKASTLTFVLLVAIELANALNSKSSTTSIFKMKIFNNISLIWAIIISFAITIGIAEIPFFEKYLHTAPLDTAEWIAVIVGTSLVIIAEEIRKWMKRRNLPRIKNET